MGANIFMTIGIGKDAESAFHLAQSNAIRDHGAMGYTGSIAEKDGFYKIHLDRQTDHRVSKRALAECEDEMADAYDKWGNAGCIEFTGAYLKKQKENYGLKGTRKKIFLFFGYSPM